MSVRRVCSQNSRVFSYYLVRHLQTVLPTCSSGIHQIHKQLDLLNNVAIPNPTDRYNFKILILRKLHTNLPNQHTFDDKHEQDEHCVPKKDTNPQKRSSVVDKPIKTVTNITPLTIAQSYDKHSSKTLNSNSHISNKHPNNSQTSDPRTNNNQDDTQKIPKQPPDTPTLNTLGPLTQPTLNHPLKPSTPLKPTPPPGSPPGAPLNTLYADIVNSLPDGIQMAFVYGSGAIQRANCRPASENVLDMILVVDHPAHWHRRNLELNPHHYTWLRKLGPRTIASFQERYGAGVYFNALVSMFGRQVKYGVVSTRRVYADLLDWESLYVAGRLHKPVYFVVLPTDEKIVTALSAWHAASLLLPDGFTEEDLYITISSLGYYIVDHKKVVDIVRPNLGMFRRMYSPFLLEDEHVTWWPDEGILEQALTFHSRHHHLKQLPCRVLLNLLTRRYQVGQFPDLEEVLLRHAYESDCDQHVAKSIRVIVQKSSFTQSSKDLLTCSLSRSLQHVTSRAWWHMTHKSTPVNMMHAHSPPVVEEPKKETKKESKKG